MLLYLVDVPLPWGLETVINTTAIIMAGGVFLLWKFQNNLIYMASLPHGSRTVVAKPDQVRMTDFEELHLETPDKVKIHAYAIRRTAGAGLSGDSGLRFRGSSGIADCTLLYLHANAGNMGHRLPIAHMFYQRLQCNIFMLSYRGYGLSEGEPSEKGIKVDAQTALDWITNHSEFGKTKVIVYGQSIGGAVAIDLVRRNPSKISALIVENTFLSIPKLIPHVMPVASYFTFLCHQVWDSETAIAQIPDTVPIQFLSGKKDELIPQKHMLELAEIARKARREKNEKAGDASMSIRFDEFPNGMHNDTCIQEGYFEKIETFWRALLQALDRFKKKMAAERLLAILKSRETKDVFKGVLAFAIGLIFVLWPAVSSWLQARTLPNVLLITLVNTPSRTVGQFLDGTIVLILSLLAGGASWALVNLIAGSNHPGMAALLFLVVYGFSILRTVNPIRYFGASLVGPILCFNAITSVVIPPPAILYPPPVDGTLDTEFLRHTIISMLVGVAITWVINVGAWPDFAEIKMKRQLAAALDTIEKLLEAIVDGYLLDVEKPSSHAAAATSSPEISPDPPSAVDNKEKESKPPSNPRPALIGALRGQLAGLTATLDAADAEISYSHLTMKDLTHFHDTIQSLSAHLFALDTALNDMGSVFPNAPKLRNRFFTPLAKPLCNIHKNCRRMIRETRDEIECGRGKVKRDVEGGAGCEGPACEDAMREAVKEFEEVQFGVLFDVFEVRFGLSEKEAEEDGKPGSATKLGWESLMNVNFLILGIHEFVDSLIVLHQRTHAADPTRRFHFHFRHFVPNAIYNLLHPLLSRKKQAAHQSDVASPGKSQSDALKDEGGFAVISPMKKADSVAQSLTSLTHRTGGAREARKVKAKEAARENEVKKNAVVDDEKKKKETVGRIWRTKVVVPFARFAISSPSIYALKCSTAVLLLNLILYAQPTFFQTWNLQSSVVTFLVAIAPNLGQTYLGFPLQLVATFIGSIWAYVALVAFGAGGSVGLAAFGIVLSIPMIYIFLFSKGLPVLGLLSLLGYANSVLISYISRNRPFDAPHVRLYKNLANVAMGLTFAVIFTLVLYPNLARRTLRALLSSTITLVNTHFADLTQELLSESFRGAVEGHAWTSKLEMIPLPESTIKRLKETQAAISLRIAAMEGLMVFCSVEPRLEGPFQADTYRTIIAGLRKCVDRLGMAWASGGGGKFPRQLLLLVAEKDGASEAETKERGTKLVRARAEMFQTVRLLLYIYSSAFISKQRLPHDLPNAFAARRRLVEAFMELAQTAAVNVKETFRTEPWVRFYSYALAIRGKIDALSHPIKDLFGELGDMSMGSKDPGFVGAENMDDVQDPPDISSVPPTLDIIPAAFSSLMSVIGDDANMEDEDEKRKMEEQYWSGRSIAERKGSRVGEVVFDLERA
ncbi:hypothetical protein HDU97_008847 [Phlyctochytrium planicorne]|nr:hypothetical protein HDU97_008847 [Phlyctochytrium planicorne]